MNPHRCVTLLLACFVLFSASVLAQEPFTIGIRDACDPGTFTAAVGPGVCKPGEHGRTTFNLFIAELQSDRFVGSWRFNPLLNTTAGTFQLVTVQIAPGQPTRLQNTGGETHTFTKVANFGGGVVPILNQLTGNPTPAPECLQPPSATNIFVAAGVTQSGPTAGTAQLPAGTTNWECCIHPWMRMVINVE
ncbi:MAG: hypothetical protein L0Z53_19925 [Acidobacteriales bacterium]|nr:hypothetical protein [Terriglobales bacterium]